MNSQFAVDSYTKVHHHSSVESASPHRLVGMLYDGAIERIVQASGAMEFKNTELKGAKINAAIAIVGGLRENLDVETGGDIAENFDALYVYIQGVLSKAHIKNDQALLNEALDLLTNMRDAWNQIA